MRFSRGFRKGQKIDTYAARGFVLCKGNPLLKTSLSFKAMVLTTHNLELPIIPGSSFEVYLHGEEAQCKVSKVYSMICKDAGGNPTTVLRPKCVGPGRQAAMKIELYRPVCFEPFELCHPLGRLALRSKGKTCAVGLILST